MMSRASGLMTRSPNRSCLIGSQYWLSAGSGSAFSLAKAGMIAAMASRLIDSSRKYVLFFFISISSCLRQSAQSIRRQRLHARNVRSFPLKFGVGRGHVATMELIKGGPVDRFAKADFIGGLLDGPAIADGRAGFLQDDREITLLRSERLRPGQVAAAVAGYVVVRRDIAQILHDRKKAGDGAVDHRRVADEQQIGQPPGAGRRIEYRQVVIGMRRRPRLHHDCPAAEIEFHA